MGVTSTYQAIKISEALRYLYKLSLSKTLRKANFKMMRMMLLMAIVVCGVTAGRKKLDAEGKLQRVKVAAEGLEFTMKALSGEASCISSEGVCPGDLGTLKTDLADFKLALKGIFEDKAAGTITAGDALGAVKDASQGLAVTMGGAEWGDVSGCITGGSVECEAAVGALSVGLGGFVAALKDLLQ